MKPQRALRCFGSVWLAQDGQLTSSVCFVAPGFYMIYVGKTYVSVTQVIFLKFLLSCYNYNLWQEAGKGESKCQKLVLNVSDVWCSLARWSLTVGVCNNIKLLWLSIYGIISLLFHCSLTFYTKVFCFPQLTVWLHYCLFTCALNKTLALCPSGRFHRLYSVCL